MQLSRAPTQLLKGPESRQQAALRPCRCQRQRPARRRNVTVALFGKDNPFADMGKLMENVKKAQELVKTEGARVQEELSKAEFEGYSDNELVRVVVSGNQQPVTCDILDAAMEIGPEALALSVQEAMKEAHSKSVEAMKERMARLASSLNLGDMAPKTANDFSKLP